MCAEIPVDRKAQPAVGFPSGWQFIFGDTIKKDEENRKYYLPGIVPGLRIFSPSCQKRGYRSADSAINHSKKLFEKSDVKAPEIRRTFYNHVGIETLGAPADRVRTELPYSNKQTDSTALLATQGTQHLSTRALRKRRCKNCLLCQRQECGRCAPCLRNRQSADSGTHHGKECCFQKVSVVIDDSFDLPCLSSLTLAIWFLPRD